MVVNVTVYDLENYPGTSKTVSVDILQVVPLGYDGDERWTQKIYTSATASGSASIQSVFMDKLILGYSKSTGANQGPYTISASQSNLKVSINNSAAREITLATSASPITGSDVAADIEAKLNALAATGADEAGSLAFKNADVTFANGQFTIKSGVATSAYTGTSKSSVRVTAGDTYDVSAHLGFLGAAESEVLAGSNPQETYVSFDYTVSSGTALDVADNTIVTAATDCIGVTDGSNTEYRYVSATPAGQITMNAALSNSYAQYSKVQALRIQDSSGTPPSVFESVDDAVRHAISCIVRQIDFSS